MRILLVYRSAPWIAHHVIPSFMALSAQVDCLDLNVGIESSPTKTPAKRMRAALSSTYGYDLVFMIEGMDDLVDLDALSRARKNGTIICNFLVDVPQEWWRSLNVARVCNVVLVAQKENAARLRRATNQIIYFPFAVSDEFLHTICAKLETNTFVESRERAVFIGSAHSRWRVNFLSKLDGAGIPIDVVGKGWLSAPNKQGLRHVRSLWNRYSMRHHLERLRGSGGLSAVAGGFINNFLPMPRMTLSNAHFYDYLHETSLIDVLRRAAVNVSTSVQGSGYLVGCAQSQFKLRDVEFPCFEVPYLTDPTPELCGIFESGTHLLYYRNLQELIGLTRDACRFPDQYHNLSRAAREEVKLRHTWTSRFRELSSIINLNLGV